MLLNNAKNFNSCLKWSTFELTLYRLITYNSHLQCEQRQTKLVIITFRKHDTGNVVKRTSGSWTCSANRTGVAVHAKGNLRNTFSRISASTRGWLTLFIYFCMPSKPVLNLTLPKSCHNLHYLSSWISSWIVQLAITVVNIHAYLISVAGNRALCETENWNQIWVSLNSIIIIIRSMIRLPLMLLSEQQIPSNKVNYC